ncbi:protein MAK16 homolog [Anopheles moucheti]|uniref:protein MAK16 homolog n=1 Tax=Anopheles moucheti TaxID=186751 RepID=UPI0022EFEC00|nr:protein MAK16 homolog [Anopheles moucheti]
MQQDEVTSSVLSEQSCSFQVKISTQNSCRNKYTHYGTERRTESCPIASSSYAAVREESGAIFLYIVTVDRNPFPVKHCKKVKLSRNYDRALYQLKHHLLYWERRVQKKCKRRLRKITQNLIRMRRSKVERRKRLKMGRHNNADNYPRTSFERVFAEDSGTESGVDDCLNTDNYESNMSYSIAKCESKNNECLSAGSTKKSDTSDRGLKRKLEFEDETEFERALFVEELKRNINTNEIEQEQEISEESYDTDSESDSDEPTSIEVEFESDDYSDDITEFLSNMSIDMT